MQQAMDAGGGETDRQAAAENESKEVHWKSVVKAGFWGGLLPAARMMMDVDVCESETEGGRV
jgi:hypothetical protein